MGTPGSAGVDEALERDRSVGGGSVRGRTWIIQGGWLVIVAACLVYILNIISPPRLMDDVDAVQAQIARNMLVSGDWVTARLDGVA